MNQYAAQYYMHKASKEIQPAQRPWVDTNITKLKVYIGVYIYMGLYPMPKISHY